MSNRKLDETQKVLFDAADVVERRGHCKNKYMDDQGRVCLQGAIVAAAGMQLHAVTTRLRYYLNLPPGMTTSDWNNRPERTSEEVVAALRGAASFLVYG
jgi:hypothetical protein